jgi:non-specific serine/threonine protein kinase
LIGRQKGQQIDRERPVRSWRFGQACFDAVALRLTVGGAVAELEPRPLQLLALLLTHAGEVVTKDEILEALWPDRVVTEASLTKCVARLRAALGDGEHTVIRTVHGYGYSFDAPVTVDESGAAPALRAAAAIGPGEPIPMRPNWRLLRRLGAGGYGEVWLGEQAKSHELRVFKFAGDAAGLAGLRREITLGRLLREGLGRREEFVHVLDWNLERPPYFIETNFCPEGSLADWCAAQGGADAAPIAVRLDLVAQIADALSAAHGMGVLHKDIKPGNVLMRRDASGRPAIALTDFGSGLALEPWRLGAFGISGLATAEMSDEASGGTALYCAPELMAGGVPTVQADIYALGVLLFQLVAGDLRLPLAPGWEARVGDPLLREDIGLAAAGDAARRLADAAELARRLRSLPARRDAAEAAAASAAAAVRTQEALARARARRGPLLGLAGVLAAGLGLSTWLYIRAEHEAARAQTVTRFLTEDLLSAANPFLSADPNIRVKDLLATAANGIDHRFPAGSLDRAAIEATIGAAYVGLSDQEHAMPLLKSALAVRRQTLGDADPQTEAVRLAMASLAERLLDSDGMLRAGQDVLAAHPTDPEIELSARFYELMGGCGTNGNGALCATQLKPLLQEADRRLGPRHPLTLKVESELAHRLGDARHTAEAIPLAREAVALTRLAYGPDHLLVQERRFYLAGILVQAGQFDEAIDILTDVRRRLLAISGSETAVSARIANQMGMAYDDMKRYPQSLESFQIALDYSLKAQGETAELSIAAMSNIGQLLIHMGRATEGVAMARRVLDLNRTVRGPDSPDSLWAENNLAIAYQADGNLAESEALLQDTVGRARPIFTHGEWNLGHFETHLGEVLAQEGKIDEAQPVLQEALALLLKSLGPTDPHTLRAQDALDHLPAEGVR